MLTVTKDNLHDTDFDLIPVDDFWNIGNNKEHLMHRIHFVHNRKIIEFDLKHIKIKTYDHTFRAKRIGRILPPYITRIQQIVSAYIIREGLPAIPCDVLAMS